MAKRQEASKSQSTTESLADVAAPTERTSSDAMNATARASSAIPTPWIAGNLESGFQLVNAPL
jgi:hypothetical protein